MKRIALAVLLTGSLAPTVHADDCMDKATSQPDMNACAAKAYRASDARLNDLYRQIEGRLKDDAEAKKHFVAAQRGWIAFRDAECNFNAFDKGSSSEMVYNICLEGLTSKRVEDFKSYLSCGDSGDVSCPVPPAP